MQSRQKLFFTFIVGLISFVIGWSTLHAADDAQAASNIAGMSPAMQKSMDPDVWSKSMAMMMDPSNSSPMANCALCHEGEDLARYQEQFGPMMDAAFNMYKAMSPQQMMAMMGPMMGMMGPMMGMMNPAMMTSMMGPMMGMMNPMMGMMNPMAMMGPMMGGMMNPMAMMGPMMGGAMNPMAMMNPMGMMGGAMNPMTMMNPMGMMGGGGAHGSANPMTSMMDPKQYEDWFKQMTEMMQNFTPKQPVQ